MYNKFNLDFLLFYSYFKLKSALISVLFVYFIIIRYVVAYYRIKTEVICETINFVLPT